MDTLIVIGAKYLIFVVAFLAGTATLLSGKAVRWNIIKLAVLSFISAFLLALLASRLFYDTRPFVVEHIEPLIPHDADNGFPSEHALYAMVAAAVVFVYSRRLGVFLAILAVLMGLSRVFAKVHYPVDIVGSVAIAIAATGIAWIIFKTLHKNRHLS
jgi:undecaprenyl-diphosphatase